MAQPTDEELPDPSMLVEVDARGRISLGKMARRKMYRGRVEADDVIILEPVRVLTEPEIRLFGSPALHQIEHFLAHPETGVRRDRPGRRPDPERGEPTPGEH